MNGRSVGLVLAMSVVITALPFEVARAQTAPAAAQDDDAVRARARLRLQQGRAFYEQGNFEAAVVEFEAAYGMRPHPTILYNMGQCYERLFRYARARDTYERFVATAAADDADRPSVLERIAALDTVLGVLVIRTNVRSAQVWIDGRLEGTAPGRVRVEAGRHRVELRARGYLPEATQIDLAGNAERQLALRMSSADAGGGVHPAVFLTATGLAVAAAGAGAVLGVRALDLSDEYEANPARTREQQSEGNTAATLADVFFIGAGVMAVTATVLLFVTDWGGDDDIELERAPAGTQSRVHLAPWVSAEIAGVSIGGVLP